MLRKLVIGTLIMMVSCRDSVEKEKLGNSGDHQPWHSIQVIFNSKDTVLLYSHVDSLYVNGTVSFMKESWGVKSFNKVFHAKSGLPISKGQADSIFILANNLIENTKMPEKFCTDYYGKIKVTIMYTDSFSKSATYTSICEWQKMDTNTAGLQSILQEIISK